MINRNLCKTIVDNGGELIPLIIPEKDSNGMGLMNPSVYVDDNRLLVNIRSINYILYHSEGEQRFQHKWGPLVYLNPENDIKLKTRNFVCILDEKFNIDKYYLTDTSVLDNNPVWEFHGLEDARLVKWNNKLYLCGVRRDVKENGEGRMELSEIVFENNSVKEVFRFRIPDPSHEDTVFCNKNWAPILDMPYHFVKWTNPTEIVKVNIEEGSCVTIYLGKERLPYQHDFRGGSQVINWGDHRMSLIHEAQLFNNKLGQKDGRYMHRFVIWDRNWNIKYISDEFSFLTAMIEFACGMIIYKNDLLITFGFQDNVAFLLRVPHDIIDNITGFNGKN